MLIHQFHGYGLLNPNSHPASPLRRRRVQHPVSCFRLLQYPRHSWTLRA